MIWSSLHAGREPLAVVLAVLLVCGKLDKTGVPAVIITIFFHSSVDLTRFWRTLQLEITKGKQSPDKIGL